MNRLTRFFTQKVEEGRICGYSLALYKKGQPELLLADGHRTLEPEPLPVLPETLRLFTTNFTPFSKVHRSVGFILKSSQPVPLSPELPPTSFFHLGFTGTSVTLDPEHEQVLAVLMNRVHPTVREPSTTDILKRAQSLLWPPDNV